MERGATIMLWAWILLGVMIGAGLVGFIWDMTARQEDWDDTIEALRRLR